MDRYQIAVGLPRSNSNITGYAFKPSRSTKKIVAYMKKCAQDHKEFFATGIPTSALDMALILLSQEMDVPILVNNAKEARSLSVAYSHKKIYHPDNFPFMDNYAIFHPDLNRKSAGSIKPILLIRRI